MEDILKQFLEEERENLKTQPFDFFPTSNDPDEGSGILPYFYLKWASSNYLLLHNNEIATVTKEKDTLEQDIKIIREILGDQLLPAHFNPKGNAFTQDYYRPGWKYFYLTDFAKTFHEHDDLNNIANTEANYREIEAVLEDRFFKWLSKD